MVGYGKKFRTGVAGFVIKVPSLSPLATTSEQC
jgi:hypothetical protein